MPKKTDLLESTDQRVLSGLLTVILTLVDWFIEWLMVYVFVTFMLTGKFMEQNVDARRAVYVLLFLVCYRLIKVLSKLFFSFLGR